jgi:hypothetical protein
MAGGLHGNFGGRTVGVGERMHGDRLEPENCATAAPREIAFVQGGVVGCRRALEELHQMIGRFDDRLTVVLQPKCERDDPRPCSPAPACDPEPQRSVLTYELRGVADGIEAATRRLLELECRLEL